MLPAPIALLAFALTAPPQVEFTRDVRPLLKERCFACHGALKQLGKLRLDSAANVRKGGKNGPAVLTGKDAESLLIERITDTDDATRMPPEGKPLTADQIATLKEWVRQGAKVPANDAPEEDPKDHWAFRKPVRPTIPAGSGNPIDALLAIERQKRGLPTAPPADKPTLLRRVTIDLIGLPPTRDELAAFLTDSSPTAYEKVVDRLLADPRHGERWGRHWMDVWRYSDWYGRRKVPDVLNSYGQIWRWRDWIVSSLNADKGYDWMIRMMLAADEIAPTDDANLVATGFVVRNFFRWNYNNWMRDNVEHTAKAFLGLTFNCCHCHDHKYDPLKQVEYFQLRAVFEPLELRHDRWPGEADPGPYEKYVYTKSYKPITTGFVRVFDEKPDAATQFYTGGDERNKVAGRDPVPPGVPAAFGGRFEVKPVNLPPEAWYPGLRATVRKDELAARQAAITVAETEVVRLSKLNASVTADVGTRPSALVGVLPVHAARATFLEAIGDAQRAAEGKVKIAQSAMASLKARIAADDVVHLGVKGDAKAISEAASRAERQHASAVAESARIDAEVAVSSARRAGVLAKLTAANQKLATAKTQLEAATKAASAVSTNYMPITPIFPKVSSGRRTALANWIASPDNPLTARAAVNHLWGRHFEKPLAETTNNLGRNGKRPTHPELLDWLASELTANGWHFKPLHRLIVTSQAYRMQSGPFAGDDAGKTHDTDNVYLWRFPAHRVEAEVVRDALLAASGELDATIGGPAIPQDQGETSRRRSLYLEHHGESREQFLELFDAANPCDAYQRSTSVLPQQALALSNSVLTRTLSRSTVAKLAPGSDDASFVRAAFAQILSRPPRSAEVETSVKFLGRQRTLFQANAAEVKADPVLRARENLIHALFNHTDFVTVR